jgi:XTP/dITP diphosphohydrolase
LNGEEGTLREHSEGVYFATGNKNKYLEAARVADAFGVALKHLNIEKCEIQSRNLTEIASYAAQRAAAVAHKDVVAEDAGFFVRQLGGFPGPYSSYVFDTLGVDGILRLMRNSTHREASFQAAVAFYARDLRPISFVGVVKGRVTNTPRGRNGFGFDPIFAPKNGDGRTFAEMSTKEKNLYSHRAHAFTKFCKWFASRRQEAST